jgi:hypothetical protein
MARGLPDPRLPYPGACQLPPYGRPGPSPNPSSP